MESKEKKSTMVKKSTKTKKKSIKKKSRGSATIGINNGEKAKPRKNGKRNAS